MSNEIQTPQQNIADLKAVPTTSANTGKKNIVFVVEDDDFLVKAYQIKLEKEGFEVWLATDGDEALATIAQKPKPDVVLLDLMLPGASGFDILAEIKKNEKWKEAPVLIMTNLGQPQDVDKGKELGAADYMIKANTKISDIVGKVR